MDIDTEIDNIIFTGYGTVSRRDFSPESTWDYWHENSDTGIVKSTDTEAGISLAAVVFLAFAE